MRVFLVAENSLDLLVFGILLQPTDLDDKRLG